MIGHETYSRVVESLEKLLFAIYSLLRFNTSTRQLDAEIDVSYRTFRRRVEQFARTLDAPSIDLTPYLRAFQFRRQILSKLGREALKGIVEPSSDSSITCFTRARKIVSGYKVGHDWSVHGPSYLTSHLPDISELVNRRDIPIEFLRALLDEIHAVRMSDS